MALSPATMIVHFQWLRSGARSPLPAHDARDCTRAEAEQFACHLLAFGSLSLGLLGRATGRSRSQAYVLRVGTLAYSSFADATEARWHARTHQPVSTNHVESLDKLGILETGYSQAHIAENVHMYGCEWTR